MSVLPLALQGPLATYGNGSHERFRATAPRPSKSAVCGLIGAALGRDYADDQTDLHALRVHVRDDQPGHVMQDFQTAQGASRANGTVNADTFIERREYLQDSAFVVVIEGDRLLLERIEAALKNPVFLLYLGTRTCLPSRPVYLAPVSDEAPEALLRALPVLAGESGPRLALLEAPGGPLTLHDQPMPGRRFGRRQLQPVTVHAPPADQFPPSTRFGATRTGDTMATPLP